MTKVAMKLRWLIAHQPAYLFIRTAEAFSKELEKDLPGQFEIEILTMKGYIEKYGDIPELKMRPGAVQNIESLPNSDFFTPIEWEKVTKKWKAMFNGMRDGKIHLSQTQVTVIGGHLYDQFATLDLPFLFDNHDHVSKVLDGQIGDDLCEELAKRANVRGLAFTYSGGYRIVGSNHPIQSLNDLKQVDITTVPMTRAFFKKLANTATSRMDQKIDETAEQVDRGGAIETTYLRFTGTNVLKTNHSMFLTTILVGGRFFKSLTPEQQAVFRKSAKVVAKLERQWSLDDAKAYEDNAIANGVTIQDITRQENYHLRQVAPQQYHRAYAYFPKAQKLVEMIRNSV